MVPFSKGAAFQKSLMRTYCLRSLSEVFCGTEQLPPRHPHMDPDIMNPRRPMTAMELKGLDVRGHVPSGQPTRRYMARPIRAPTEV